MTVNDHNKPHVLCVGLILLLYFYLIEDMKMSIDSLQRKILLMTTIGAAARIVMWIAIGWLSVEAILHIGEHGLKHLIDTIWFGEI